MNLNEECLLKYLKFPDGLSYTTQLLKLNEFIMEKQFIMKNFIAKSLSISYTD